VKVVRLQGKSRERGGSQNVTKSYLYEKGGKGAKKTRKNKKGRKRGRCSDAVRKKRRYYGGDNVRDEKSTRKRQPVKKTKKYRGGFSEGEYFFDAPRKKTSPKQTLI